MNEEIWKAIPGYEGLYEASTEGRIRSVDRTVVCKNGKIKNMRGKILKSSFNYGYEEVHLCCKTFTVHRLVAKAFPEICGEWFEGCEVDHINTIKHDNHPSNLRVTDRLGNVNNPLTRKHNSEAKMGHIPWNKGITYAAPYISEALKGEGLYENNNNAKPILQYSLDGEFIKEWACLKRAVEELDINKHSLSACLHHKRKTCGGYCWVFKN